MHENSTPENFENQRIHTIHHIEKSLERSERPKTKQTKKSKTKTKTRATHHSYVYVTTSKSMQKLQKNRHIWPSMCAVCTVNSYLTIDYTKWKNKKSNRNRSIPISNWKQETIYTLKCLSNWRLKRSYSLNGKQTISSKRMYTLVHRTNKTILKQPTTIYSCWFLFRSFSSLWLWFFFAAVCCCCSLINSFVCCYLRFLCTFYRGETTLVPKIIICCCANCPHTVWCVCVYRSKCSLSVRYAYLCRYGVMFRMCNTENESTDTNEWNEMIIIECLVEIRSAFLWPINNMILSCCCAHCVLSCCLVAGLLAHFKWLHFMIYEHRCCDYVSILKYLVGIRPFVVYRSFSILLKQFDFSISSSFRSEFLHRYSNLYVYCVCSLSIRRLAS